MKTKQKSTKRPATLEHLRPICQFVTEFASEMGFDDKTLRHIELAIDEACTNIIRYAYSEMEGEIEVDCKADRETLFVTFRDHGVPYDPTQKEDPILTADLDKRQIGGLGIYIIKNYMDQMEYNRIGDVNEFTLTKKIVKT